MRALPVVIIFMIITTMGSQVPMVSWTFEDLGLNDIIVENPLEPHNVSAVFSSELVGAVTFTVILYANCSLRVKLTINNVTVELYTNQNSSFDGFLENENILIIKTIPQPISSAIIIYKNSTITARLKVGGEQGKNVANRELRLLFWASIFIPPILVYLYRRRVSRGRISEGEGVVIV